MIFVLEASYSLTDGQTGQAVPTKSLTWGETPEEAKARWAFHHREETTFKILCGNLPKVRPTYFHGPRNQGTGRPRGVLEPKKLIRVQRYVLAKVA